MAVPSTVAQLAVQPTPSPELGEGSIWWAAKKKLLWLDIMGCRLFMYDPVSNKNEEFSLKAHAEHVSSVVPIRGRNDVAVTLTDGFYRLNLKSGKATKISEGPGVATGERFNDGKVDPQGRYWAGTIARDASGTPVPQGFFYRRNRDGTVDKIFEDISISNGLSWSSDGKSMYYTDTATGRVDVCDYTPATGEVSNRRPCITGFDGHPDGHCMDSEGMLWVALFNGGGAERYDPSTGKKLARVDVPETAGKQVTSVAFGGDDLGDLYITTAHEDVDASEIEAKGIPHAGALFRVPWAELEKLGAAKGARAGALHLPVPKKGTKVYDYSGLQAGMRVQAESGGAHYAAQVVQVSTSAKRSSAPVKVNYAGYDESWDEWVGGDRLRSRALKVVVAEEEKKLPRPVPQLATEVEIPINRVARVYRAKAKDEATALKLDGLVNAIYTKLSDNRKEKTKGFLKLTREVCKTEWAYECSVIWRTFDEFTAYQESEFGKEMSGDFETKMKELIEGDLYMGVRVWDMLVPGRL